MRDRGVAGVAHVEVKHQQLAGPLGAAGAVAGELARFGPFSVLRGSLREQAPLPMPLVGP